MAYQIQVSARILSWPRVCACCCGPADTVKRAAASRTTGKRVQHTKTSWWEVPYCTSCLTHEATFRRATTVLVGGVAAMALIFVIASVHDAAIIGWLLVFAAAASAVWGNRALSRRARSEMRPGCSATTGAVAYAGWYGTFHTFVFASSEYLDAFTAANARKTMSDVRRV
jgi:hypothetical protein